MIGKSQETPDYKRRLNRIERYGRQIQDNALFIESEQLIDNTEVILDLLTDWLKLGEKLSPHYKTFKYTGVRGYGDPSEIIKTGKIIKEAKDRSDIYLPPEVVRQAAEAHASCRKILLQRCDAFY